MTSSIADRKGEVKPRGIILPGAPWAIAHKSMLEVNQPYKFTLNEQDYVIWKNNFGEVFALDNICPHMQAPLSNGWICPERNTIVCPFHGLEFTSKGKRCQSEIDRGKSLIQPLELTIEGDIIWTYGNLQPHLPISNLISSLTLGCQFLGVAGERSIKAPFLDCLKINYDFNHAIATHNKPFRFDAIEVSNYQENGYYTKLEQEVFRTRNNWREILLNPILLTIPKVLKNQFEYAFPSITGIRSKTILGEVRQLFLLYPETETTTKTFILVYFQPKNRFFKLLSSLPKQYFLKSFDLIVEQDSSMLENLYSAQKSKIRLPREEIMFYAEQLYYQWQK